MSLKRTLAIVGALVLALVAGTARSATAGADASTHVVVAAHTLTDAQMSSVSGGFTKWRTIITKFKKRIRKFVVIIICFGDTTEETTTTQMVADDSLAADQTDYYEETVNVDEFYDESYALVDRHESSTGVQYTGSSGGGGSTCIDNTAPGCEAMY